MKIDKSKLVEILVEKTGMKQDEVESQLTELIGRIKTAAEKGKALEIKGFGLFYFDENEDLKFDPANELKTEINFKYAGMEPVEVKPPRDTSTPRVEDEDPQADADEPEDNFGTEEAAAQEQEGEEISDSVQKAFDELLEKPSGMLKEQDEEEVAKSGTHPKQSEPQPESEKKEPKKKKKDPILMVVLLMIGVLLAAVGYFAVTEYMSAPPPKEPTAQEQSEVPPVPAERDVTEYEQDEPEELTSAEEEPQFEQETEVITVYGLMGDLDPAANDGFTIVLHSMQNQQNAEQAAQGLRDRDYRTLVTERTIENETVYRVGIGQFATIEDALDAAQTLPQPYNQNHFIQRIQ